MKNNYLKARDSDINLKSGTANGGRSQTPYKSPRQIKPFFNMRGLYESSL